MLIELLAIVVILAVIALITIPIIEDTKKDVFLRNIQLVISTTDIDIAKKAFDNEWKHKLV